MRLGATNVTPGNDFHRMMEGATKLKCSEFGDAIIKHMGGPNKNASKPAMAMA